MSYLWQIFQNLELSRGKGGETGEKSSDMVEIYTRNKFNSIPSTFLGCKALYNTTDRPTIFQSLPQSS